MSVAVFDVDGVVADVRHRLPFVQRRPKDWRAFFAAAVDDPPLEAGFALLRGLARALDIVWLTGRPSSLRSVTETWLTAAGVTVDELYMRPPRDFRPAATFKLEVLGTLATRPVAAFVDDDPEVVAAARAVGIPSVLADWVPREPVLREVQDRLGRS